MNKGIRDIIGIVNSDDWLEPDALGIVSNTINNEKLDYRKPLLVTGWNKRIRQAQVSSYYFCSCLIPYPIVKLFRKKKNK